MGKVILLIKDIFLIIFGNIFFIFALAMINQDSFGIVFFGVVSLICFYFSKNRIKTILVFTIKMLQNGIKEIQYKNDDNFLKKKGIIITSHSYSAPNPYNNAVPIEVYKYAYSKNKAKTYPNSYIVFDTETTGLEPEIDKIIEIGAIKYVNNEPVDTFSALINPEQEIDPFITKLTGITNKDLSNKPTIKQVLPLFFDFIEDFTLIAHNTPFDIKMIACECYRNNIPMCNNKLVDTIPLAKRMIPRENIENYKLSTLKEYFKINIRSHRALEDCEMCNIIYQYYLKFDKANAKNKKIVVIDEDTGEIIE